MANSRRFGGVHFGRLLQPVVTGPGEPAVTGGPQLFVLSAPHQIDGFGEVFGNVEFVEHTIEARSPDLIANELYIAVATYNLIRAVMAQAAAQIGLEPRRLSFSRSQDSFRAFVHAVACLDSDGKFKYHWKILLRSLQLSKLPSGAGHRTQSGLAQTQRFPNKEGFETMTQKTKWHWAKAPAR